MVHGKPRFLEVWRSLYRFYSPRLKEKGASLARRPRFRCSLSFPGRSEHELDRELNHSVALLLGDRSEVRRIQLSGGSIESEIQVGVVERPQRMVEEVVTRDSELQFLRFADLEILEQSEVPVKERR